MDIRAPAPVSRFGVFELDTQSGELRRHGLKIRLPDQSFQILKVLLSRPGEVVTREELQRVLWTSDTFVDFEVGLNSAVRKLREALDDSAENPRFIETLPRRGYRFIAAVSVAAETSAAAFDPAPAPVGGDTPEPSAARSPSRFGMWRAAALVVVALVAAAGAVYQRGGFEILRAGPATEPIRSLVVLPFENFTGDVAQDYFVDSVTDALTSHLAQVPGLDVISRTTARQLKQRAKLLPEIGKELQVDGAVEGAVVRSGTGVRITATLIRAATDRHVWSQTYEGDVRQMLALQQRIASDVAVAAGHPGRSATEARAPKVIDARAYESYLKGLAARGQRYEGFRTAVGYFEEAIAIQPDFAEAYAALALTQIQFLYSGPLSPHETIPKAEAAARKALQLDDTLAEAHRVWGQILTLYYWRWAEGEKALQRAANLSSGRLELALPVTGSLIRHGRFDEALAAAERARKLDPLSFNAQIAVGNAFRAAGQHDRALQEFGRALVMSPGNIRGRFALGVTFVAMGRMDEAIRELEPAARPPQGHNSRFEAYLGYAYAAAGRTEDAREVLNELQSHRRDQYVSLFGIALIHDALGEKEPALAALQRAHEDRAVEFAQIADYPPFKTIASDPRFQAVMRSVGHPRSGT